jgi:hypothetical protein
MEVSGQLHAPAALPPGKDPPVPNGQKAGWAPEPFWMLWRIGKSCPCWESNPGHPAHSLSLYQMSYPSSNYTHYTFMNSYFYYFIIMLNIYPNIRHIPNHSKVVQNTSVQASCHVAESHNYKIEA